MKLKITAFIKYVFLLILASFTSFALLNSKVNTAKAWYRYADVWAAFDFKNKPDNTVTMHIHGKSPYKMKTVRIVQEDFHNIGPISNSEVSNPPLEKPYDYLAGHGYLVLTFPGSGVKEFDLNIDYRYADVGDMKFFISTHRKSGKEPFFNLAGTKASPWWNLPGHGIPIIEFNVIKYPLSQSFNLNVNVTNSTNKPIKKFVIAPFDFQDVGPDRDSIIVKPKLEKEEYLSDRGHHIFTFPGKGVESFNINLNYNYRKKGGFKWFSVNNLGDDGWDDFVGMQGFLGIKVSYADEPLIIYGSKHNQ